MRVIITVRRNILAHGIQQFLHAAAIDTFYNRAPRKKCILPDSGLLKQ